MSTTRRFVERIQQIALHRGWRDPVLPGSLLSAWELMVDQCATGYESDLSEYLNDLSVRGLLQSVLDDPDIQACDEYAWFAAEVQRIDGGFRDVLHDGPVVRRGDFYWWNRRVPSFGQQEFVDDVRERYSVELGEVD
ncbi:hypothetical protein [Streptomyces sp. A30]|uniref:hypothetical protein n=1 Tax=Streptomyces sp. A30 TaxID=2789273 RepID=UPI003980B1B6